MQHPYWISVVFFFVGFSPGVWLPSLPSVLDGMGYSQWIPWVYGGLPIGALVSPLFLGALSDGKIPANRLCGYVMIAGGISLTLAFSALQAGVRVELFIILMFLNSLLNAPIWSLATQASLAYLSGQEDRYPYYRLWATIGWLSAGLVGGLLLQADSSPLGGIVAGVVRFPAAVCCFLMPLCQPLAVGKRFSFLQMLGEGSKELWTDRNTRVLLISSSLIALPLAGFFMYCPLQMKALGVERPTAWMTIAQWFEIPAMLTLSWACLRFPMKHLITLGLGVVVLRQGLFMIAAETGVFSLMILGFLTHGMTYTYYLTVAQMYMEKRVAPELRGRAQGMLSLVTSGIGSLLGVFITAQLFEGLVDTERNTGWPLFWGVLALLAALPSVYFFLRFKSVRRG